MPNSWHKAENDLSCRVAATTNRTFCSSTSMVCHGILYTPAPATLARKCKGCPETFCKGCHETEHVLCERVGGENAGGLSLGPRHFDCRAHSSAQPNGCASFQHAQWS